MSFSVTVPAKYRMKLIAWKSEKKKEYQDLISKK